ncbi:Planctomycete cytochrome C [Novipirellula galeiformis]|uniref:Planctomycete cytochrome C n=1 Tax=Novipirellula galeiformis TaxID=2528004 RepID=A0A5C6C096_9BACT|nr:PSD1 and planctomycete cytochrome C domain-containing protein [Novipirellula galeiformis]TWU17387.1 Planctomycete cytochrome C [Novipirellula galeiformis]
MKIQRIQIVLVLMIGSLGLPSSAQEIEAIRFSRDVLPILSDRCFHCHGPDPEHREADLRLDDRESAIEEMAVIVPMEPDASELIARIISEDHDKLMPPPESHRKPLTQQEIEILRRWIAEGAKWGTHWSFEKLLRPEPPQLNLHPIDAFVQRQLEEHALQPSTEADRRTLIRRVTLDLIGLPPSPAEVDAFLADDSPQAYENLVDRLLQSPHYGERMAWPWLDAARYADTSGYQGDPERSMWPWRDWVITALNENMPFDQFTIEQIAGDLLPEPTPEQRLATGFNRNHMHNGEGGRIAEETRVENVFDRAETTGTVWLGLTLQCARCHDHKFDPTTNVDYFAFTDFFNQTSEAGRIVGGLAVPPAIDYVPEEQRREIEKLKHRIAELAEQLVAPSDEADAAQTVWESAWGDGIAEPWRTLDPSVFRSSGGAMISKQADLSLHVTGERPEQDVYEITFSTEENEIRGLRLEALVDSTSPGQSTGRDNGGNFVLSEIEVTARPVNAPESEAVPVKFVGGEADFSQDGFPVEHAIDGRVDKTSGWAVSGHKKKEPRWANFYTDEPIGFEQGTVLSVKLRFESRFIQHTMALFRIRVTDAKHPTGPDAKIATLLRTPVDQRREADQARLREHFRRFHWDRSAEIARQLDAARRELVTLQANAKPVPVMVMDTRDAPRETFVLVKGIYNDVTDRKVVAAVPSMLPPLAEKAEGEAPTRLDLARWIVAPENPLTARVTVNRYWQMFFGRGIVSTMDDFGLQGAQPTHPDLLDWLAVEFVESGWDVKHMHRMIVTSQTYRQSSHVTPESLAQDPENKLLSRAPRYRMPSWMIRDHALAASGLLLPSIGGPPVKPYQPDGIWSEATFGKIRYQADTADKLYRRSLYTFWRRIVGPTILFDAAKRQTCEVNTNLTNTPLHALTTLNDVTYLEAARVLAGRLMKDHPEDRDRITMAFVTLTSRPPEAAELELLEHRLESYVAEFRKTPENASELLTIGDYTRDTSLDPAEHAAYTTLLNTLMNLDETLVKP